MSGIVPGHVPEICLQMSGKCPGHFPDVFRQCPRNFREISRSCFRRPETRRKRAHKTKIGKTLPKYGDIGFWCFFQILYKNPCFYSGMGPRPGAWAPMVQHNNNVSQGPKRGDPEGKSIDKSCGRRVQEEASAYRGKLQAGSCPSLV